MLKLDFDSLKDTFSGVLSGNMNTDVFSNIIKFENPPKDVQFKDDDEQQGFNFHSNFSNPQQNFPGNFFAGEVGQNPGFSFQEEKKNFPPPQFSSIPSPVDQMGSTNMTEQERQDLMFAEELQRKEYAKLTGPGYRRPTSAFPNIQPQNIFSFNFGNKKKPKRRRRFKIKKGFSGKQKIVFDSNGKARYEQSVENPLFSEEMLVVGLKSDSQIPYQIMTRRIRKVRKILRTRKSTLKALRKIMYPRIVINRYNSDKQKIVIVNQEVDKTDLINKCRFREGKINAIKGFSEGKGIFEILFVIDVSGSQVEVFEEMKKHIETSIAQLLIDIPEIRFGFICFGDWSDWKEYFLLDVLDFTNDPGVIKRFLGGVNGTGGGKNVEKAYELAFLQAKFMSWNNKLKSDRYVLLIGDAVPYPPQTSPLKIDIRKIVKDRKIYLNKSEHAKILSMQCKSRNTGMGTDSFYREISTQNFVLKNYTLEEIFPIFMAVCYKNKPQGELESLLNSFQNLSIGEKDEIKKIHTQLNRPESGSNNGNFLSPPRMNGNDGFDGKNDMKNLMDINLPSQDDLELPQPQEIPQHEDGGKDKEIQEKIELISPRALVLLEDLI